MKLSERDKARTVQRLVIPHLQTPNAGLAIIWDHRFQSMAVTVRCGHANDVSEYVLKIIPMLKALEVRPEELRAIAQEIGDEDNLEAIEMVDLCKRAIDSIDVKGKSVLDIGGYDGEMAAYCLERGAKRAVVLDSEQWKHYGWPRIDMPAGVEYIHDDFTRGLEAWRSDVVLCFNVIYHLDAPHQGLEVLKYLTRETMLLCTMYVYSDLPVWRVYEPNEVNPTDDTVYWAPSATGLMKSLKVTGWRQAEEVGRTVERMVVRCVP